MLQNYIAVGLGGCLGALVRYALSDWVVTISPDKKFPMGTFVVNVAGCLLIGFLMALAIKMKWTSPVIRLFLISGFLGAMTTFSTFGYQTVEIAKDQSLSMAGLNLFGNLLGGLLAVLLGIWFGESLSAAIN